MRFVVDTMLGRLAKWLRALGYDTYYQSWYSEETLTSLIGEGRILITRNRKALEKFQGAVWVRSDYVRDQVTEVKSALSLRLERSLWFTRCMRCNAVLREAGLEAAKAHVPEHVFHESGAFLRLCPGCGRYYWPGSHRVNMLQKLESWAADQG